MSKVYEQVYAIVRRIPAGKVLTYGLLSAAIDGRLSAQGVGWAMRALKGKDTGVPWHRVVNSRGGLSTQKNPEIPSGLQQVLLEREGIEFNTDGCLDLDKHLWLEGL